MTLQKNVLVVNCGSSSVKFAIINSESGEQILSGLAERLGSNDASIQYKYESTKQQQALGDKRDHLAAIQTLVDKLTVLNLKNTIFAIGHRVVHGGERFTQSVAITDEVISEIKNVSDLAPLHNPANLVGIDACQSTFCDIPQVAVFDTAFHQSMPDFAYLYAIDHTLYKEHGIRKYGFHGTSHYYVSRQAASLLGKEDNKTSVISVHLGNGCSICAVENGQSVDTSLGLTPVAGLVMGTRSGDIDPGLLVYLMRQHEYTAQDIDDLLNKKSGLLGLSQLSNDCRTLEQALTSNKAPEAKAAKLALDVFCYRVAKYIASYLCALSHLDAVIFTGGIGENSSYVREKVIERLTLLNVFVDDELNQKARFGQTGEIQTDNSNFKLLVIPTNEEWVIAQDAAQLVNQA